MKGETIKRVRERVERAAQIRAQSEHMQMIADEATLREARLQREFSRNKRRVEFMAAHSKDFGDLVPFMGFDGAMAIMETMFELACARAPDELHSAPMGGATPE